MKTRVLLGMCGVALLLVAGVACGDSDKNYQGEAAQAAARFFDQEAAAGVLPEGTLVRARGSKNVVELDAEDAKARLCVEFEYIRAQTPFDRHYRVYVTTLDDGAWTVEPVNPDGTCEGVA